MIEVAVVTSVLC